MTDSSAATVDPVEAWSDLLAQWEVQALTWETSQPRDDALPDMADWEPPVGFPPLPEVLRLRAEAVLARLVALVDRFDGDLSRLRQQRKVAERMSHVQKRPASFIDQAL